MTYRAFSVAYRPVYTLAEKERAPAHKLRPETALTPLPHLVSRGLAPGNGDRKDI